ncbi:MAG: ATP-binding protein, partial [Actinomycetota bacterium]
FVGRERELAALRNAIDAAAAGRGSLLMVAGEPGIGKTRLTEEAAVYARLQGGRTLTGRCYEAEAAVPYIPFVEAIRSYVADREPGELAQDLGEGAADVAKLVSEIRARIPDLAEPPPSDPDQERYRLLEAVSRFLVAASAATPTLLVLDDLHWADSASLSMLAHLARRIGGSRLAVVGTYRDVELDRQHPLAEMLAMLRRERLVERVLVRGLNVDEVLSLLEASAGQTLGAAGRALAEALERETEGNPFFIEEIVRHLIETGVLYRVEGRWRYDVSIEDMGIPEGVREVIGRRLSRLPKECNEVLLNAAVLGRDFDFPTLVTMTGTSEDEVLPALELSLEHQLIVEVAARSEPTYSFTHALVRQTLYDEPSLPRKQRLHLRAAQAIEQVRQRNLGPHAAALATHYRMAGTAAAPDKAIDFSVAAAGTAWTVAAWVEAIGHLEGALDVIEQTGARAEILPGLLENLGTLMYISGVDPEAGVKYLERSLALHTETNDRRRMAVCRARLGFVRATFKPSMNIPEAFEHLDAAQELLRGSGQSAVPGYVQIGYATAHIYAGNPEEGLAAARKAAEIGTAIGSDAIRINADAITGYFHLINGRPDEGAAILDRAFDECERHNLAFVGFVVSWLRGSIGVWAWDPVDGLFWVERELAQPRTAQAPNPRRVLLNMRAHMQLANGRAGEIGDISDFAIQGYSVESAIEWWNGDFASAADRLRADANRSRAQGDNFGTYGSGWWLALVEWARGDSDAALKALDDVLEVHREVWVIRLNEAVMRAVVLAQLGRVAEARRSVSSARELLVPYTRIGALDAMVSHADACVTVAEGRIDDAVPLFSKAATGLQATGASVWR